MQLPRGFEAVVLPRSSTYAKYKITMVNSMGVIDNSYCGKDDIWKMPVIAQRDTFIPEGVRIAQFRIQLSQKATIWQKIKWLFSGKIKLLHVTNLDNTSRGGFGSTGENNYVDKKTVKEKKG
jgi:dUTP pyrophosphatase